MLLYTTVTKIINLTFFLNSCSAKLCIFQLLSCLSFFFLFVRSPSLLPPLQRKVALLTYNHNISQLLYVCLPAILYYLLILISTKLLSLPKFTAGPRSLYLEEMYVHGNANTNGLARQLTVNSFLCLFSLEASWNSHSPLLRINLHKTEAGLKSWS